MTVIDWPLYMLGPQLFPRPRGARYHVSNEAASAPFVLSGALCSAADLSGVHTVYLMPMARGLDQYLANRLTTEHVFRVVTDPKLADAVFTDHIGEGFQAQLDAMLPPPPDGESRKDAGTKDPKDSEKPRRRCRSLMTETANKLANPALTSTFGRAKGTVFLVECKSRQVVWSVYEVPKDTSSKEMDRTATDIVSRLKR